MNKEEYIKEFENKLIKGDNLSLLTADVYTRNIHRFYDWMDNQGLTLESIRPGDIDRYKEVLGLSPESVNQHLSAISSFYNFLLLRDHIVLHGDWLDHKGRKTGNPVSPVTRPYRPDKQICYMFETQARSLVDYAMNKANGGDWMDLRNAIIIRLFLVTGIRREELQKTNYSDIREDRQILIHGKGNKERYLTMDTITLSLIQQLKQVRPAPKPGHENAIFTTRKLCRISLRHIDRLFKSYVREVFQGTELAESITPHKCRHTFGRQYYIKCDYDMNRLRGILGHARSTGLAMTVRYSETVNNMTSDDSDMIAASFFGESQPKNDDMITLDGPRVEEHPHTLPGGITRPLEMDIRK